MIRRINHRLPRMLCEAALSDRQTKQLVLAGRTSKVEWTYDDTIKAFGQGWGLFTAYDNKVMRVLRIDGNAIAGIDLKPRVVFHTDELARAWVKRRATAGSDLHRRAWALDGKTNCQAQD
jgi:hypothetical protein